MPDPVATWLIIGATWLAMIARWSYNAGRRAARRERRKD
jgi:hypothetical protein